MSYLMIDVAEMQSQLSGTGRIARYGIQFDVDKATIKPESKPTLSEMVAFMPTSPNLQVVIVGHTDNHRLY